MLSVDPQGYDNRRGAKNSSIWKKARLHEKKWVRTREKSGTDRIISSRFHG